MNLATTSYWYSFLCLRLPNFVSYVMSIFFFIRLCRAIRQGRHKTKQENRKHHPAKMINENKKRCLVEGWTIWKRWMVYEKFITSVQYWHRSRMLGVQVNAYDPVQKFSSDSPGPWFRVLNVANCRLLTVALFLSLSLSLSLRLSVHVRQWTFSGVFCFYCHHFGYPLHHRCQWNKN